MKVLTFLGDKFNELCRRLADEVLDNGFDPDLVVGVLTGGGIIGRISYEQFKKRTKNAEVKYIEVKLQRPSTKNKEKKKVKSYLPYMPKFVLNWMRILEVYYYEVKVKFVTPRREGTLQLDEATDKWLKEGGKKVVILDDCIDTGYTLRIIKDYLIKTYPGNDFRVAVATVSHRHPVILPDYQLYNRVLLRFPWAVDVKKSDSKV